MQKNETIAAIATPSGEGAIAIIRISGSDAIPIANQIFSGDVTSYKSHTAHYGKIVGVDNVLLLVMRAPKSYTGEDTVEIFCHGGSYIARQVLQKVIDAGAKPAAPGAFSLKAYLNGKLDLAQAEAVQQLIAAKNDLAVKAAESQLEGALSATVTTLQKKLTDIAAILEAWVDFPEEDLEFSPFSEVINDLQEIANHIEKLLKTFRDGKILTEGISLCLVGSPNVGKSSLMNVLLGKDRAIVTDIAGTTRDLLEEELLIGDLHFRLIDTAGIRETAELVEQEGIKRSHQALQKADLVLLVLDASRPKEHPLLSIVPLEKTIVIWNKIDLATPPHLPIPHLAHISAKQKQGIPELKEMISKLIWKNGPPSQEEIYITSVRHKEALHNAHTSLCKVISGLKNNVSAEFASSDMRQALNELGTIVGTNVTEDILSAIFSKFCIGK